MLTDKALLCVPMRRLLPIVRAGPREGAQQRSLSQRGGDHKRRQQSRPLGVKAAPYIIKPDKTSRGSGGVLATLVDL